MFTVILEFFFTPFRLEEEDNILVRNWKLITLFEGGT